MKWLQCQQRLRPVGDSLYCAVDCAPLKARESISFVMLGCDCKLMIASTLSAN